MFPVPSPEPVPEPPPASQRPPASASLDVAAADEALLPGRWDEDRDEPRGESRGEPRDGTRNESRDGTRNESRDETQDKVRGGAAPRAPGPRWVWEAVPAELPDVSKAREPGAEREPDAGEQRVAVPSRRERAGLAVRERLPVWLQARCGLERRGVVALVVVLAVAALFAAQHFWTGRTQPVRPPDVVREAGAAPERGTGRAASPGSVPEGSGSAVGGVAAAGAQGGRVVVDVSGKVRSPGVQRLPAGSRVADALRAAGGVRPGADLGGLNRARVLVDGEQVVVGAPPEPPATGGAGSAGAGASGVAGAGAAGAAGAGGAAAAATPVGLNTASAAQLDELPGVGPVLAQHIIDYRTEHGGFRSVDELREVNGIGDRRFADLQDLVRP
ncbi:helix-hairpin-helix domain-containing protein [Streptomyces flavofungini]|uniref:helix-hairpin-helix domain-containing protein n=1 Tax=Streptomyces flavofungini TaxID=68200 RepID=UPI003F7D2666